MNIFKILWCKIIGHKPNDSQYIQEADGSVEEYLICKRCGYEINRKTHYDGDGDNLPFPKI